MNEDKSPSTYFEIDRGDEPGLIVEVSGNYMTITVHSLNNYGETILIDNPTPFVEFIKAAFK